MKRFIKSFLISLLAGLPLVFCAIGVMYFKSNQESKEIHFPEENLIANQNAETALTEAPVLEEPVKTIQESDNTEPEVPETVTFAFAGDVYFSEHYLQKYEKDGISAFADEEMLALMRQADYFMFNHEFVFSLRGEAMEDKEYTLRCDPKYVNILQELGTDGVSIANNHVLDFGKTAFLDTLDTLEVTDIAYVGGGRNLEEASAPVVKTVAGETFAIFAATRVSPSYDWYASKSSPGIFQTYDAKGINEEISKAENKYDHTIVFVHWGIERNEYPEEYQRTLARGYIDAGADLVIGCHPHVLQGVEYYQGVPIIYSLGNYLFSNRTGETMLLNANFFSTGELQIQLIPCERSNGVLTRIQEPNALYERLEALSFGVSISEEGVLIP